MGNKIVSSTQGTDKINSYDWDDNSNSFSLLVQIYYNSFREQNEKDETLYNKFGLLYKKCNDENNYDLKLKLLKLICHIRDIHEGKGEYNVAYNLLFEIYKNKGELDSYVYLDEIINIVKFFVDNQLFVNEKNTKSYGSWKDIKYFCDFLKNKQTNNEITEEDFKYIVTKLVEYHNNQIKIDLENLNNNHSITLAAKWIPREKSKFRWLYFYYLRDYFKTKNSGNSYVYPDTQLISKKSFNWYAKLYRKEISKLSNKLEITQIYQCNKKWSEINFENITSITLSKQYKSFMNKNQNKDINTQRKHRNDEDRKKCKENFKQFINDVVKVGSKTLNSKHINIGFLVGEAIKANQENDNSLKEVVNTMFAEYCKSYQIRNDYIVIADNSTSVKSNEEAYYNLVGLSILIAINSKYSKSILCFGKTSAYLNLDNETNFCDYVNKIVNYNFGKGSDLSSCLDLIIDSLKKQRINSLEINKIKIVILSDMQVDYNGDTLNITLNELLNKKFSDFTGENEIINRPKIIFWNFISKNNFPILSNTNNSVLVSGYSPNLLIKGYNQNLLNTFVSSSYDDVIKWTPYTYVEKILNKNRYSVVL